MLLTYLFLGGWAVWLGSVVFVSFVLAPTAFTTLGREGAVSFLRALFPRYYAIGLASGTVMLAAALGMGADLRVTVPVVVAMVLAGYARQVVTPAVQRARAEGDEASYARLHRMNVRLNVVTLALLLLLGTVLAGTPR